MQLGRRTVPEDGMSSPLVGIVTPLYNAEPYLAACIRSIQTQSYPYWEWTLVDNCSTDASRRIADEYARTDARIHVRSNDRHVGIIANHNLALRALSPAARYCKFVLADDWLFPDCLAQMVEVAERHPSVGIVGAYCLFGTRVTLDGLPHPSTVVPGRELARGHLLRSTPYVLGTPHSLLFRGDLIRNHRLVFDESTLHADIEFCLQILRHADFGFVHQVLTFTRTENQSTKDLASAYNTLIIGRIRDLLRHGPAFLTREELQQALRSHLQEYYAYLAASLFHSHDEGFWSYHRQALREAGLPLDHMQLAVALCRRLVDALGNPQHTLAALVARIRHRLHTPTNRGTGVAFESGKRSATRGTHGPERRSLHI